MDMPVHGQRTKGIMMGIPTFFPALDPQVSSIPRNDIKSWEPRLSEYRGKGAVGHVKPG